MVHEVTKDWSGLLESVILRRDRSARYFKPVCLLAVCSLIDQDMDPANAISAERVLREFEVLLAVVAPTKANQGWMPLWHLTTDRAWVCKKLGKAVSRDAFEQGKPKSRRQLLSAVDAIALAPQAFALWSSTERREQLKLALFQMMAADEDEVTRQIGRHVDAVLRSLHDEPDLNFFEWLGAGRVFVEDLTKYRRHVSVERDTRIIKKMKPLLGYTCNVCGFNYEKVFGALGTDYIELHHIVPVSELQGSVRSVNPEKDFAALCANCHRMIHRLGPPWSEKKLDELRALLQSNAEQLVDV